MVRPSTDSMSRRGTNTSQIVVNVFVAFVEAIQKIASVRSVVQPLEFFLHQLEIFERCNFELNPNKHAEYRHFLMNFNAQEMIGKLRSMLRSDL